LTDEPAGRVLFILYEFNCAFVNLASFSAFTAVNGQSGIPFKSDGKAAVKVPPGSVRLSRANAESEASGLDCQRAPFFFLDI